MNFAMIGAAGYIAKKHMEGINSIGSELVMVYDISDSVGILDTYFPKCVLCASLDEFKDLLLSYPVDYLVICSPNHLHYTHIKMAHNTSTNVICEKPLFIKEAEFKKALEFEKVIKIHPLLQFRYYDKLFQLRHNDNHTLTARYIVHRGEWYNSSWKAIKEKSGGINFNIGAHLFDIATMLMGNFIGIELYTGDNKNSMGLAEMETGMFQWYLSINGLEVPERSIWVNGEYMNLSVPDLHYDFYRKLSYGNAIELSDVIQSQNFLFSLQRWENKRLNESI